MASGELTDEEAADTAVIRFQAGLETTGETLALGAFVLRREREQLELLRQRRVTIEAVVEELLRHVTPIQLIGTQQALVDEVDIGGVHVARLPRLRLAAPPDELGIHRTPSGDNSWRMRRLPVRW